MKIIDKIASFLQEDLDLSHLFTVSGANIEDFLITVSQQTSIKIVMAKHEYSAGNMAQGYFLASGKLGVVCTTSGGGAFNLFPSLAEAKAMQIPLLAIIGGAVTPLEGKGVFQDTSGRLHTPHLGQALKGVTVSRHFLKQNDSLIFILSKLCQKALKEKGPVALVISKELQNLTYEPPTVAEDFLRVRNNDDFFLDHENFFTKEKKEIERFFQDMEKRPVIIVGENHFDFKMREKIQALIKKWDGWIATTANGKSFVDHYDPHYIGGVGLMGDDAVYDHIQESTHVILLGTSLPFLERAGLPEVLQGKKVLSIHSGPHYLAMIDSLSDQIQDWAFLHCSLNDVFSFLSNVEIPQYKEWPLKKGRKFNWEGNPFYEYFQVINKFLGDKVDVYCDAGNVGASGVSFTKLKGNQLFAVALGMGGMGYSLGLSVGGTAVSRNTSYVIVGDGAFYMHGFEIHTALENKLPMVFFIFNNNAHAMCEMREQQIFHYSSKINSFHHSFLGKGLKEMFPNLNAFEVNSPGELDDLLQKIEKKDMPAVLSINIDAAVIPPFKPFMPKE